MVLWQGTEFRSNRCTHRVIPKYSWKMQKVEQRRTRTLEHNNIQDLWVPGWFMSHFFPQAFKITTAQSGLYEEGQLLKLSILQDGVMLLVSSPRILTM